MPSFIERLARRVVNLETKVNRALTSPQLGSSSIEDGTLEEYDENGQLVTIIGKQPDGTHGAVVVSGPVPPQANAPTAAPTPGGVTLGWDGTFALDGVQDLAIPAPLDFTRTELHVSQDPGLSADTTATLVDTFESPRGASRFVALEPGTWYAALVVRAASGKRSAQSRITEFVAEPAATGDVSDIRDAVEENRREQELLSAALDIVFADLDTLVGEAPLPDVVARHLAAYTAAVMELDVARLRVSDASIGDAVAERLLAEVVNGRRVIGASIETSPDDRKGVKLSDPGLVAHGRATEYDTEGKIIRDNYVRALVSNRRSRWGGGQSGTEWPGFWFESDPVAGTSTQPLWRAGVGANDGEALSVFARSAIQTALDAYSELVVSPDNANLVAYAKGTTGTQSRVSSRVGAWKDGFAAETMDLGGRTVAGVKHLGDGILRLFADNGVLVNGVALAGTGAWTDLPLLNGWRITNANKMRPSFRRTGDTIEFRGSISGGTSNVLLQVPLTLRALKEENKGVPQFNSGGAGWVAGTVSVAPDGYIRLDTYTSNVYSVNLDFSYSLSP